MRARWRFLLLGLIVANAAWGCGHDPQSAAEAAETFARVAFQKQNVTEAYALLTDDARLQMSKEQLGEVLVRMHPIGAPSAVHAVEYEVLPKRAAVNVFILGDGTGESFNYRLTMDGGRWEGYGVGGLYRYLEGFPQSTARTPLPSKR